MPSSPLADLLNTWAAQQDDSRRLGAVANTIQQYGLPGQPGAPQPVPQQPQGGILSNLLGLTSPQPQQQAQPAAQPDQGGFFSRLLGIGGGSQQPGQPLNLQPSFAPPPSQPAALAQPFNVAPAPAPAALRPTFPSAIPNRGSGTVGGYGFASADAAPAAPSFAPAPSGPLPTFAAAGGAPGQDNTSRALAFYQSKGLSPIAASALVGGFHAESGKGLNTTATNVGDGTDGSNSIGIAQWNGDRARGLQQFAAANGLDPRNIDTQLQYSWLELNGPEKGTLQALMNPNLNPGTATAAALGYERPAGWSAANPYGAKTFGSRLKNTVALSQGGFSAPFDGSAVGPDPTRFTPDPSQGGGLPTMAASGYGMQLAPDTPNTAPAPLPLAGSGGTSSSGGYAAYDSRGKAVATDAAGNALGSNGQPTTLAYGGVPAGAGATPASRTIAAAAPTLPTDDPLVTVPGYSGQWNRARIAAAPDGTDVPDDGELARAQSGSLGGATRDTVQVPTRGPGTAAALSPAASQMQAPAPAASASVPAVPAAAAGVMPQQSQGAYQVTPQLIGALLQNEDTRAFGIDMWKTLATTKTAPIVSNGWVLDGRTGQPLYQLPQKPETTDAIKNFQFGQANPAFQQYQQDQQKGDKAQLIDIPLPNGQFQKAWATPGQIPTSANYVGQPYTRQPANQVTIDQKAESSQEGEVGKAIGQEIGETIKAGATAPQALNTVRMMRAAAAAGGDNLSTGPFGQAMLKGKQAIGNILGIEIPGTSEAEVLNNLGYGLATQAARAISNRPTQFEFGQALQVKPGIAQSPAGFQALLNIRQQDLEDQLALGKLASVKANRDNWLAVKAQYYADHPVMSPFDPTQPLGPGDVQAINASAAPSAPPQSISSQDASALPVISSPEAAARLKPGTLFKTPDGRIKQR